MTNFSARALSLAIISLMNERKRAIEAHNLMDPMRLLAKLVLHIRNLRL